jgi:hypothetical protein
VPRCGSCAAGDAASTFFTKVRMRDGAPGCAVRPCCRLRLRRRCWPWPIVRSARKRPATGELAAGAVFLCTTRSKSRKPPPAALRGDRRTQRLPPSSLEPRIGLSRDEPPPLPEPTKPLTSRAGSICRHCRCAAASANPTGELGAPWLW